MMGVWFLANAVANKLSGVIGGYAEKLGEFDVFLSITIATAVAGAVLLAIAPMLKRMMHGADETQPARRADRPRPRRLPRPESWSLPLAERGRG